MVFTGLLMLAGRGIAVADLPIYTDTLASGWQDWSWGAAINSANSSPIHGGVSSIAVALDGWGALQFGTNSPVNLAGYDMLNFWVHGGTGGSKHIDVVVNSNTNHYTVVAPANTWTDVSVPLSAVGNPAVISTIWWMDNTGSAQTTFYIDDISLHAATGPPPPPAAGPALTIDAGLRRHAISEDIYGMNFADEQLAAELRLPVNRWGGNSTTRYNWQTNMHNVGFDWYFENIPNATLAPNKILPNGSESDQFVEQNNRTRTKSLITVPLIGWTPKAPSPTGHPYDCGFKVTKYGAQYSVDSWDTDCGNGVHTNGTNITGNDPTDTSTAIGPDFVTNWINHLVLNYGTAQNGGATYYALDNEPMLWNSTHRDVHPLPATYDELRDKAYLYAPAIKAADSSAKVFGPVLWGWCAYLSSALDQCTLGADYAAHGSKWFVEWYLGQMQAYEQQHGRRILDYLDVHGYPYANGVSLSPAGDAATQALRLRSTKDLWDPTYTNEGWVSDSIHLIPRMHDWVNNNYPGTKLAITEYNWGGLEHINGALAQADVLGIFGREGLDLATIWGPPSSSQPGAYAFRVYRNYDGAGSAFGDRSIAASSTDQDKLSVYAAQRGSDCVLTMVAINKTSNDITSDISLAGFSPASPAEVYRYSATNLAAIVRMADQAVAASGFNALFPSNSITLLVMPQAISGPAVKINGTPASSLLNAYQSASGSGSNNIQMTEYTEQSAIDFSAQGGKDIVLKGGYNCAFDEPPPGYTTILDAIIINTGSIVMDRIIIK